MKTESWTGLVTNASPYAIPLGAAVEQVNFHNATPGQLESRGGMRRVSFVGALNSSLDCFYVNVGGKRVLLSLSTDGIHALESPNAGPATGQAAIPDPSSSGAVAETTYLFDYAGYGDIVYYPSRTTTGGGDGGTDTGGGGGDTGGGTDTGGGGGGTDTGGGDGAVVFAIVGGTAASVDYAYVINANEQCDGDNRIYDFFGGRSSTSSYPRTFENDRLCPFLPFEYDYISSETGDNLATSQGDRLIV